MVPIESGTGIGGSAGRWVHSDLQTLSRTLSRALSRTLSTRLATNARHRGVWDLDLLRTRPTRPRRSGYHGGIAVLIAKEQRPRSDGTPCRESARRQGDRRTRKGSPFSGLTMEIPFSATVDENGDESGVRWGHRHSGSVLLIVHLNLSRKRLGREIRAGD